MKANVKKLAVSTVKILAFPVFVVALFAVLTEGRIVNVRTLSTVLRQSVYPAIICYALVLNMTMGAMNFAAGAVIVCASIFGGNLMVATGTGIVGLFVMCLLAALVLSAIMGALYNVMRIPMIVLAIGMVMVYEAVPRLLYEEGVKIPFNMTYMATAPYCFIVLAVMMIFFYLLYFKTAFGHNLRALGSNQEIAINVGLNNDRIKFLCFIFSGVFLGIAATLYLSNQREVRNVTMLNSMLIMMESFMCMFLAFFLSRFGNLTFAVLIGTFTMKFITTGFSTLGISPTVRDIATGLLLFILFAMSANQGILKYIRSQNENARIANEEYLQKKQAQAADAADKNSTKEV